MEQAKAKLKTSPRITLKWKRFPWLPTASLKTAFSRPLSYVTIGGKETGKSSLVEAISSKYTFIVDLFGCYDDKTEVLTKDGWKLFSALIENDVVATLDLNGFLVYTKPTKLHKYQYKGEMISIKGKCDLLVTPNHRMLVITHGKRQFIEAKAIYDYAQAHRSHHMPFHIPKSAKWNCSSLEYIELPMSEPASFTKELLAKHDRFIATYRKCQKRNRNPNGTFVKEQIPTLTELSKELEVHSATLGKWANGTSNPIGYYHLHKRKVSIENFMPLLGWYLAEGSPRRSPMGISFALNEKNPNEIRQVSQIITDIGFKPHFCKGGNLIVHSQQLYELFRPLGDSHTKYIPQWVKDLPSKMLELLIFSMVAGDGHKYQNQKGFHYSYTTVSKKLADDLQEICIKSGYATTLCVRKERTVNMKGRAIKSSICYEVTIHKETAPSINRKSISKQHYEGFVYCVSVPPNETVLVRRNGKIVWSGNSRDNEGLAWLRSPMYDKRHTLFLKDEAVKIDCNCADVIDAKDFKVSMFDNYKLIISAAWFYPTHNNELRAIAAFTDKLWWKVAWETPICIAVREAASLLSSRHIIGEDQTQAIDSTIRLLREIRHCGFAIALDTLRWFGVDRDVRAVTDYTFIKATGTEGLPQEIHFLYRYWNPFKVQQMNVRDFLVISREGALGTGSFDCPYWHKEERENLLTLFDIKLDYDNEKIAQQQQRNPNAKVVDLEHTRIISLRLDGKSFEAIGKIVERSPHTTHEQVRHHNNLVAMKGTCDKCYRAQYEKADKVID